MLLTAVLKPAKEGGYFALNLETGTTSQGETVDQAIANLRFHFLCCHSAKQLSADSEIIADTNSDVLVNGNGSGFSFTYDVGGCSNLMPCAVI